MTPQTIAYVIDDLGYGGAQKQVSLLARHLPAPYRAVVISLSETVDPFAGILEAAGVDVVTLIRRSSADVGRAWKLKRTLDNVGASLVHGFLDAANVYAFVAGRLQRIPVVLSLRNENLRLSGLRGRTLSWMLRHADGVLVNSRAGEGFLTHAIGVTPDKVLYAPNWVDPDFVAAASNRGETPPGHTFGCVARFHSQKRLHLLIEALPLVREHLPDARLVLQGDGPEREALQQLARDSGADSSVEFIAPGVGVAQTLARLDCFALPSEYEGLPNAAIEALAMGVPLIASETGDVGDLIRPDRTGLFIRGNDARAVAGAITTCLSNRALAEACRTAGPELVERQYSMTRGVDRMTDRYASILTDF